MEHKMRSIPDLLERQRIDELLALGIRKGNVSVVAAPGYGKTCALSSYLRKQRGHTSYLRLTPFDNDIDYFLRRLAEVMADKAAAEIVGEQRHGFDYKEITQYIEWIKQQLSGRSKRILVLDDYQVIKKTDIHFFVEALIKERIQALSIILVSRSRAALDTIKRNDNPEFITEMHLGYTPEEVEQIFKGAGKTITADAARQISEYTEGWPIMVHQICERAGEQEELGQLMGSCYSDYAANLFEKLYFGNIDSDMRSFLIKLSLIPIISLDIVKHMLPQAFDRACYLLATHQFIRYDYDRNIFMMHRLYRQFLLSKRSFLTGDERQRVHKIAAAWYDSHGFDHEAMEAWHMAGEYHDFFMKLDPLIKWRNSSETIHYVLERLSEIPEQFRRDNPQTDFYIGIFRLQNNQVELACQILSDLAKMLEGEENRERYSILLGETYIALENICNWLKNIPSVQALRYSEMAAELIPPGYRIRCFNSLVVEYGHSFFLEDNRPGEVESAMDYLFERAKKYGYLIRQMYSGIEYLYAAKACFERYELDEAHVYCYQAIRMAKQDQQHDVAMYGLFILLKVWIFRSNYDGVQRCLEEIKDYEERYDKQSIREFAEAVFYWFDIYVDNPKAISEWVGKYKENILSGEPIKFERSALLCAVRLAEKNRNLQLAHELLIRIEAALVERSEWVSASLLLLAKAKYYLRVQDEGRARQCFLKALKQTYNNRIVMPFIQMGSVTLTLIDMVRDSVTDEAERLWMLTLYEKTAEAEKRASIITKQNYLENRITTRNGCDLTKREREVLSYLAEGWTSSEIAHVMSITINGVKKHLARIYTKLGAINRADAVHIATVKGIIDQKR